MAIITQATSDDEVTITLDETFDFNCVQDFRAAYEGVEMEEGVERQFVIDLRRTHYMDSSALGMLINMQKYWKTNCHSIRIINSNPQIKKIFAISRFDKKFNIE